MLSLDHFYIARDKEILHVSKTGEESACVPVYFYNHGEPKMIGSIGKGSLRAFDDFIPEKKLKILCNLLELSENEED